MGCVTFRYMMCNIIITECARSYGAICKRQSAGLKCWRSRPNCRRCYKTALACVPEVNNRTHIVQENCPKRKLPLPLGHDVVWLYRGKLQLVECRYPSHVRVCKLRDTESRQVFSNKFRWQQSQQFSDLPPRRNRAP